MIKQAGQDHALPSSGPLALALTFMGGRGVIALSSRRQTGPAVLESLEMEIPDIRFPFDLSGGVSSFRHRRCQLRQSILTFPEQESQRWLTAVVSQAAFGYRNLRLRFGTDIFEVSGQAAFGDQVADFIMRGFIWPGEGRSLQISLCDLLVFGVFPVPAPLLAAGLLHAAGARPAGSAGLLRGCCDVALDPLTLSLLETLPASGWRLPAATQVLLSQVKLEPGRLTLHYTVDREQPPLQPPPLTPRLRRFLAQQEAKGLFQAAEESIREANPREAVALFRRHLDAQPGHPFILERLLQLLSAEMDAEEEIGRLVQAARALDPDFIPALLAQAILHLRRGEMAPAATLFRRIADLSAAEKDRTGELTAAMAAGRCALAVDRAQARKDFERTLELDRDHESALVALAPLYAEASEWTRLVRLRQRQISLARDPDKRILGHLALGELFRVHLANPERAREQYQLALELDPLGEPALRGLAEACIDADNLLDALRALDRLCGIVAAQGNVEAEIAVHLRIASLWEHLGDGPNALARLQRVLVLQPDEPQALRRTASVLRSLSRDAEAVDLLEGLFGSLQTPANRLEVHRELAQIHLGLANLDQVQRHLDLALAIDPTNAPTLQLALRAAEQLGDPDAIAEALTGAAAVEQDAARQVELNLRLGRLLLERGRHDQAVATLQRAARSELPSARQALLELGSLHQQRRSWSEARAIWERVVALEGYGQDARSWLQLGLVCQELGESERALECLERARALAPSDATLARESLQALARLRRQQGDLPALCQTLEALGALPPGSPDEDRAALLCELGHARQELGDLEGAATALQKALVRRGGDLELAESLGRLQMARQDWEAARPLLEGVLTALANDPALAGRRSALALDLGTIADQQDHPREAIEFYRRALDEGLTDSAAELAWDRIIELHLARHDPGAAARASMAAAARGSREHRADRLFFAGQLLLKRTAQSQQAIRCFHEALEHQPRHAGALDALESIYSEKPDHDALVGVLQLKVEAAGKRPVVQKALLTRLGEVLAEQGRREEALNAFTGALSLDGDHLPALLFLARSAWDGQEQERAEVYYRRQLASLSRKASVLTDEERSRLQLEASLRLAHLMRRKGQVTEEEGHLEVVLTLDPRHREALSQLDALLSAQGRTIELIDVVRRRAEIASDLEESLALELRRGNLLEALPGRALEAVTVYRHVLQLRPAHEQALARLTGALRTTRRSGELVEVLTTWAEVVAEAGRAAEAKDLWIEAAHLIRAHLDDPARALALLRQASQASPEDPALLDAMEELLSAQEGTHELELHLTRRISLEEDPGRRAALELRLAGLLVDRGETEEALRLLRRAREEGHATTATLQALVQLHEQREEWREAAEILETLGHGARQAEDRPAELRYACQLLVLLQQRLDAPSSIEALCRRILELDPMDKPATAALADLYQEREAWPALAEMLQRLLHLAREGITSSEEEFLLISRLSLALDRDQRRDEVQQRLEEAMTLALQERSLLWPLTGLARDLAVTAVERRCLAILAEEAPEDGELHLRLARLQQEAGERADALRSFLAAAPHVAPGPERTRLALELIAQAETAVADEPIERELLGQVARGAQELLQEAGADTLEVLLRLARLRRAAGEPLKAVAQTYQQALAREPRGAEALEALIDIYAELADHERLTAALVQKADHASSVELAVGALCRAATVMATQLGRPREALPLLQRALELRPEDRSVLRATVELHQLVGEPRRAEETLLTLAGLGDEPEDSLNRACGLAQLRGDPAAVVLYLSHLARIKPGDRSVLLRLTQTFRASGDLHALGAALEQLAPGDEAALLELARLRAGPLGDPAAARDTYRRLLDLQPDHREGLIGLIEICDKLGRRTECIPELRQLRDREPAGARREELTRSIALRLEEAGDLVGAGSELQQALTRSPQNAALITSLAENLARQHHWEALVELLEEKLSGAGLERTTQARLALLLGETYLDHLDIPDLGTRWLHQACARSPEGEGAFKRLITLYRERQSFAEIAELLQLRLGQLAEGERAPLWRELGFIHENHLGDPRAAAAAYATAWRDSAGHDPESALQAQHLFVRCGDLDRALALLTDAVARSDDASRAKLLAARARILGLKGRLDEAMEGYELALKGDPQLFTTHAEVGKHLFARGMFQAALAHLQTAAEHLSEGKEAAQCGFLAGRALERLGMNDEALARFEQAATRDPTLQAAHEAQLPHLERREAWDRLCATLTALLSLSHAPADLATILTRLATIQLRLGHQEEARQNAERAISLQPEAIEAIRALRRLAEEREDWPLCAAMLEREIPLTSDPTSRGQLRHQLTSLLVERLQETERAIGCAREALDEDPGSAAAATLLLELLERAGRHPEAMTQAEKMAQSASSAEERARLLGRALEHARTAELEPEVSRLLLQVEPEAIAPAPRPPADRADAPAARSIHHRITMRFSPIPPGDQAGDLDEDGMEDADLGDSEEDWHARITSYRARAQTERDPVRRADLLLHLARMVEEKLARPLDALAICREAQECAPDHLPALEALADMAYRNQIWHLARELYDRLCQEGPADARGEAFFRRGLVYETLGDEATADASYAEALALDPVHRTALEGRTRLALFRDDLEVAIAALLVLSRIIPVEEMEVLADVREQLGKLFLRRGDLASAQGHLEGALALDASRTRSWQALLAVHQGRDDHVGTARTLEKLIANTSDPLIRASLLHHLAEILGAFLGDVDAAIANLLKAYDLAPHYPPTLWRLIDYYWEQEDLSSLAEMSLQLLTLIQLEDQPPDPRHARMAVGLLHSGDLEQAIALLKLATSREELLELALLDLDHAITAGIPLPQIASLLAAAVDGDLLRPALTRLLGEEPRRGGLVALAEALDRQE